MNPNVTFALFSCCLLVKGANRSVVCDLQRQELHFIPNQLYVILSEHIGKSINEIKKFYSNENDEIIDEYFEYLEKAEIIFETKQLANFPKMNLQWKSPSYITNAIIDLDNTCQFDTIEKIASNLDALLCRHVQFRLFNIENSHNELQKILVSFENTQVEDIQIITKYSSNISTDEFINLLNVFPRIRSIHLYSAPKDNLIYKSIFEDGYIYHVAENLTNNHFCGKIYPKDFGINIPTFTEAHHHNSCLNRKISIDVDGNIKNCPSMEQSFGNIKDTTLQEALDHPEFKKYWNITKDQIAVCKDCEFRYICTDCRAYLENPHDMYAKPLKCGYNPYTCEWEEWSTNPLKQQAIDYYGMREVLPEFKLKPDYVPPRSKGKSTDSTQ